MTAPNILMDMATMIKSIFTFILFLIISLVCYGQMTNGCVKTAHVYWTNNNVYGYSGLLYYTNLTENSNDWKILCQFQANPDKTLNCFDFKVTNNIGFFKAFCTSTYWDKN